MHVQCTICSFTLLATLSPTSNRQSLAYTTTTHLVRVAPVVTYPTREIATPLKITWFTNPQLYIVVTIEQMILFQSSFGSGNISGAFFVYSGNRQWFNTHLWRRIVLD